jgi:S-adenosylmethionine hydrolase
VLARTFADVSVRDLLVYEDAGGAVAVAVNGGDAAALLGVRPGARVRLETP